MRTITKSAPLARVAYRNGRYSRRTSWWRRWPSNPVWLGPSHHAARIQKKGLAGCLPYIQTVQPQIHRSSLPLRASHWIFCKGIAWSLRPAPGPHWCDRSGTEKPGPGDLLTYNVDVRMYQAHPWSYRCRTNPPVQIPPGIRYLQCPNGSWRNGGQQKITFLAFVQPVVTPSGLVLIPCHVEGELHPWTRSTALSFAAELDGHVLGTLCAVTWRCSPTG